ncbi:hypothetical protein [Pedobacter sp. UBA4863]|uniref:hypothetical protein n=1 Tax=Pedobacter sp. UBA4863 TaxID=1947060 RepID=UPI0025D5E1D6|nr:hypothetical protein [Pedobacter sp. UBA4863]
MKTINLITKETTTQQIKSLMKQPAHSEHGKLLIDEEAMIYENEKLIAVYKKYNGDITTLLYACEGIRFSKSERANGIPTNTSSIGYIPRNPLRVNACQPSDLLLNNPVVQDVFVQHAEIVHESYKEFFELAYQHQLDEFVNGSKPLDKAYLLGNTTFSGGVVNKDNSLHYHFDTANTPNGISCMLMLANNINGGELVLPQLDIRFACQNGFMLLFDGQKYLHGVSRIIKALGGYRYTIVYYNNKGMKLCLPPDQEYERFKELNNKKAN